MSCGCQEQRAKVADAIADGKPVEAAKEVAVGAQKMTMHALRALKRILKLYPYRRKRMSPELLAQIETLKD